MNLAILAGFFILEAYFRLNAKAFRERRLGRVHIAIPRQGLDKSRFSAAHRDFPEFRSGRSTSRTHFRDPRSTDRRAYVKAGRFERDRAAPK
ncbi:hypothetical protein [uncultured Pleomorphomonas sp.]|uniref:hypothetical protein n=1 Tax=uncultured Pleomorphomonas sp. TaxID=442121 RepID=UPI002586BCF8|nr:hypothetical protein [uncultured Pleomorphomonas sp.]